MGAFAATAAEYHQQDELIDWVSGGQLSRDTTGGLPNTGSGCWKLDDTVTAANTLGAPLYIFGRSVTKLWVQFAFRKAAGAMAKASPFLVGIRTGGFPYIVDLSTAPKLEIMEGATVRATGTTSIADDTWYEALVLVDGSGTPLTCTVWLWDGSAYAQECTYSAGAGPAGATTIQFGISRGKGGSGSGVVYYLDDYYVIDTTGSRENSQPTQPRHIISFPTSVASGVGTYDDWPGNCADVDDSGVDDGDGTYDESGTGTALERQTYNMDNPSVPAGNSIGAVGFFAVHRTPSGANGQRDGIIRHGANEANFQGGALQNFTTTYGFDADFRESDLTGAEWTATAVNALELGAQRAAAATDPRNLRATLVFCLLAYYTTPPVPDVLLKRPENILLRR